MRFQSVYDEKGFLIFDNKIIINKLCYESDDIDKLIHNLTLFENDIGAYGKVFEGYECGMGWDEIQEIAFIETPDIIIIGTGWVTNQIFFDILNEFFDEKLTDYLIDINDDGNLYWSLNPDGN
ncbi:MAG: hypothetical protein PHT94_01015 [Candidatus Nanoarchaeia archaeon]|nr:hypothetical protein [Candidatus Nanoarchaeia archaeon]